MARQPLHARGVFLNGFSGDPMEVEGQSSGSIDLHTLEKSVKKLNKTLNMLPDGYELKRRVTPLFQQLIEMYEEDMKIYSTYRGPKHSREDDERDLHKRRGMPAREDDGKKWKRLPVEASFW